MDSENYIEKDTILFKFSRDNTYVTSEVDVWEDTYMQPDVRCMQPNIWENLCSMMCEKMCAVRLVRRYVSRTCEKMCTAWNLGFIIQAEKHGTWLGT